MKVGSLFSGIGGLELGLERAGMEVRWQSEIDPFACRVLEKHWPDVPNLGDITQIDWQQVEPVDLICGGFPCQDISVAGKGAGIKEGTRSGLWFEFERCLRVLRPRWVVIENVRALLVRGGTTVLGSLAGLGYDAEWAVLRAADFGAPHRRDRVFIVAYAESWRSGESHQQQRRENTQAGSEEPCCLVNPGGAGLQERLAPSEPGSEGHAARRCDPMGDAPVNGRDEGWTEPTGFVGTTCATGTGCTLGDANSERGDGQQALTGEAGRRFPASAGRIIQPPTRSPYWDDGEVQQGADGTPRLVGPDVRGMVDGFPAWLDRNPGFAQRARGWIDANAEEATATKALQMLRERNVAEEVWRQAGGRISVPAQEVLFAFVQRVFPEVEGLVLSADANAPSDISRQGAPPDKSAGIQMRGVFRPGREGHGKEIGTCDPSCESRPHGQQDRELAGSVSEVSCVLARHTSKAWDTYFDQDAKPAQILMAGVPDRVAKLRALGNAVVPAVAEHIGHCIIEWEGTDA